MSCNHRTDILSLLEVSREPLPAFRGCLHPLAPGLLPPSSKTADPVPITLHIFSVSSSVVTSLLPTLLLPLPLLRTPEIRLGPLRQSRIVVLKSLTFIALQGLFCHVRLHVCRFWQLRLEHLCGAIILPTTNAYSYSRLMLEASI